MPGARRPLSRIQNTSPTLPNVLKARENVPTNSTTGEGESEPVIRQPRHAHIPDIAPDHNVAFELLVFVFSVMGLCLQYINLYKTVWWLPQSHATYALNFYLIDPYLSALLVIIMFRRFIWCVLNECGNAGGGMFSNRNCCYLMIGLLKLSALCSLAAGLVFCTYHVVLRHSLLYSLFLLYPLVTYVILFGVQIRPFFAKTTATSPPQEKTGTPKHKPAAKEPSNVSTSMRDIPHHVCSFSPEAVREEVEFFKTDFNTRIKQVLFNSMLCAYYMGFIPLCFTQNVQNNCESCWNTVYYDPWWVSQHVVLVWVSSFVLFTSHYLPPRYVDVLHRCSLHLGRWVKVEGRHAHVPYNAMSKRGAGSGAGAGGVGGGNAGAMHDGPAHRWSELQVWQQGSLVKHVRGLFKAEGINNSAEPGNSMHARFYFMFQQPLRVINWLLVITVSLVGYQFLLLIQAMEWSHIVSLNLIMFCNFYVLFKLLRDRWLLQRSYQGENTQYQ